MSYTNYASYTAHNPKTFHAQFTADAHRIVEVAQEGGYDGYEPIKLAGWDGGEPVRGESPDKIRVTRTLVSLNGDLYSHGQALYLESGRKGATVGCCTHMNPYDVVVKAIYLLAQKYGILEDVRWDGTKEDDSYAQCVSLLKAADVEIDGVTDIPLVDQINAEKVEIAEKKAARKEIGHD